MQVEPLISCLCITRSRVPFLKRAIQSFKDQKYINKELVIVYENDDISTKEFLGKIFDNDIIKIEAVASPKMTLGGLRNLSISECNGEYFCQWDDDDWSHNNRLVFQMEVIQKSRMPACVMFHWLIFDALENQAYVSNRRPWEGSILCKKSLIIEELKYEDNNRGEDTTIVKKLFSKNLIFPVVMPKLYIYVYHGKNAWLDEHWGKIFRASKKLSANSSRIVRDILDCKYSGEEASEMLDQISE
ncbi:MAG TPA: glycosyltransferase family A protein [Thermodesulfobacteriota bacterium]|jgi:glycosyltransferase involved in cell wall biosynthesis